MELRPSLSLSKQLKQIPYTVMLALYNLLTKKVIQLDHTNNLCTCIYASAVT